MLNLVNKLALNAKVAAGQVGVHTHNLVQDIKVDMKNKPAEEKKETPRRYADSKRDSAFNQLGNANSFFKDEKKDQKPVTKVKAKKESAKAADDSAVEVKETPEKKNLALPEKVEAEVVIENGSETVKEKTEEAAPIENVDEELKKLEADKKFNQLATDFINEVANEVSSAVKDETISNNAKKKFLKGLGETIEKVISESGESIMREIIKEDEEQEKKETKKAEKSA